MARKRLGMGDYAQLADKIQKDVGGSVLYLPMRAGGYDLGKPLVEKFDALGISYNECPVSFDRGKNAVTEPTPESFHEADRLLTEGNNKKLLWDDAMVTGFGFLGIYDFLRNEGVADEDIVSASIIDNVGFTRGMCVMRGPDYKEADREELIEEAREYISSMTPVQEYRVMVRFIEKTLRTIGFRR